MTTVARRPLSVRQPEQSIKLEKFISPFSITRPACFVTPSSKRPRSPDLGDVSYSKKSKSASQSTLSKSKVTLSNTRDIRDPEDKQRQKQQRQLANQEFITKYTKAFPTFVFFFDERCGGRHQMENSILALGGKIEYFFSSHVTHVITNCPQPPKVEQHDPNKENYLSKSSVVKGLSLKSPIQLKICSESYDKLVRDALRLNRKIWSLPKLESVLSRLVSNTAKSKAEEQSAPLTRLLEEERLNGTTERDPKEKRHDYQYFSKGSHFFLVEDIRNEVAPIAIMEYASLSRNDKTPSYPVLYMDPRARSPFTKYDEKEARKQEKIEANEKLKDAERARRHAKVKELLRQYDGEVGTANHLRRRASMSNLEEYTRLTLVKHTEADSLDGGETNGTARYREDDQVASGIAPSTVGYGNGYIAASGNSVVITSTTTTSLARNLNPTRLPSNLREQLGRQVIMNRKFETSNKENIQPRLKKSKSTTTMRLPAREETKKPGYCEACRVKFDDFTAHLKGSRHRKFARNNRNYAELDILLQRLERKTLAEGELFLPSFMTREGSVALPDPEIQATERSDGSLGPGDYFYTSPKALKQLDQCERGSVIEEAEVENEVEIDDEEGYIILDDSD